MLTIHEINDNIELLKKKLLKWKTKLKIQMIQIAHIVQQHYLGWFVCFIFLITMLVVIQGIFPPIPWPDFSESDSSNSSMKNFEWLQEDRYMSNYIRPTEKTSFLSPPDCGDDPVKILILILSAPHNFKAREVVRQTWADAIIKQNYDVKIVFIMGRYSSNSSIPFHIPYVDEKNKTLTEKVADDMIYEESVKYQNILLEDFTDTYLNLTLKTAFALKWAANYCRKAKYIFKVDDNVFVDHENLVSLVNTLPRYTKEIIYEGLEGVNVTEELDYTFAGHVLYPIKRNGDKKSKYFMPPAFYNSTRFPTFIRGLAYIFSGSLLTPLYSCVAGESYIPGEDVMVSGICASDHFGLRLTHHPGFWRGPFNMTTFDMCLFKEAVAVHDFPPAEIENIFKTTQNISMCPEPSSIKRHTIRGTIN